MGKKHKKHKKVKIKRKKKSSKYSDSSTSDSETSSEEVWVEKKASPKQEEQRRNTEERDEWMSIESHFPSVSRQQLREEKNAEKEKKEDKFILDNLGQTDRELNPYWKNGGTGLPEEEKLKASECVRLCKTTVGDQGVHWLRKALQRAKEQAAEEGRRLEDVVADRWGSLEKLETMLADAEKRENEIKEKSKGSGKYDRKEFRRDRNETKYDNEKRYGEYKDNYRDMKDKDYEKSYRKQDHKKDYSSRVKDYDGDYSRREERRRDDDYDKQGKKDIKYKDSKSDKHINNSERKSKGFIKPEDDDEIPKSKSSTYSSASSKGWRKKDFQEKIDQKEILETKNKSDESVATTSRDVQINETTEDILSDTEMNALAAKVMKAELMGNMTLATELQAKLNVAQTLRSKRPTGIAKDVEETVILTRTDAKGFSRPLTLEGPAEPTAGRRKGQKMDTHKDGKRMRYFADDDKYTLQDMFQREKLNTIEDQNEMFAKLASKGIGRDDSARDMDDVFEETARVKESEGKTQARERDKAIKEHKRSERALDNCEWCLDSKLMCRHLIIAIGDKCYLCLPPYQSLTEGHCLIVPTFHTASATLLDEDVWNEIQTFRKSLTNLFLAQDEDVVFFESSMHLRRMPHMVLHCVPLPKETGDLAPIYFKKAILECETEWSTNKKLVDLSGKDIRRAVPKGLPYFAVDFGLQAGYAHVIEDETLFPRNFGQEIIGGMLDLDHSLWRKPKKEKVEQQTKKVIEFSKLWKSFDCTKNK